MQSLKEQLEKLKEKLPEGLRKDKKLLAIAAVCVLGILLIALSALPEKEKKTIEPQQNEATNVSGIDVSDYITQLENKLSSLISGIDGAGKTRVMLTLENSSEDVYAGDEQQKNSDSATGVNSEARFEYITIKAKDGSEQGLLITVIQPRVRGVAVVCEGGGSAIVESSIIGAVTAVLDVSAARVSVSQGQFSNE